MAIGSAPAWRFERLTGDVLEKLVTSKDKAGEGQPKKDERLYCSACGFPITRAQARIAVNGAHEHQFTNPHGIRFRVGCYEEAPGCRPRGAATDEHTWFPGYAWRVTVCASCQQHLGWDFNGPNAGRFFALIVDRLSSKP